MARVTLEWGEVSNPSRYEEGFYEPNEGHAEVHQEHHHCRQEVQGIHGRRTSRDEGARPRAEVGSARGQGGRGKRRAREDRCDAGTGSRHGQAAPCNHQSQRASPLAENLVRDARVRQGRQGRLLLPKRAEVQDEVRDLRLQRQGEPRRRRHVGDGLRAEGVDARRRGKDRRARAESGELMIEVASGRDAVTLTYDVFINDPPPQDTGLLPNGEPKLFSPVASTLVYGREDAVLTDPGFTTDQARALGDWVAGKGRNLTDIFITHGHGDHWFAARLLAERFGARVVATPGTIALMHANIAARPFLWDKVYQGIPQSPVTAVTVPGNRLTLEGHDLVVVEVGHGDTDDNSVLQIPDLG